MKQNINKILNDVLMNINPSKEELNSIEKFLKNFISETEKKFRVLKIDAEIFVGGSFAKKTLTKKGIYDIDVFARFDEKYRGKDISKLLEKAIGKIKKTKISKIHGSRDYFKAEPEGEDFFIEIIPVLNVKNPKEAENITDLSYFHVSYIKRKLRTEKMFEEVRLAKAFCHAHKCYGAESYINGFSGYAIELLVYYYSGFLNFVKAMAKIKDREIIDIEKLYKNKLELNMNMNSAKMGSPIVLIDPTYKERNALAALSRETFENFQEACRKFLKNPSAEMFETKKIDFEKEKKNAQKGRYEFIRFAALTDKQEGDVAGSKLVKFYKHLGNEIEKFYEIKKKDFEYGGEKEAGFFFVVKNRKEIVVSGPEIKDKKENIKKFKMRHKNVFEKKGRFYAKEKNSKKIEEFVKDWMNANSQKMMEMYIRELRSRHPD
ncbi:MAG: nucleotidyltransferase domain-containing protein [Candidatus Pacearchaeota archaeon]|nr:nucleotidyltransferase domain-containing protein [Candidatus Pacearchaeota archaeon]